MAKTIARVMRLGVTEPREGHCGND